MGFPRCSWLSVFSLFSFVYPLDIYTLFFVCNFSFIFVVVWLASLMIIKKTCKTNFFFERDKRDSCKCFHLQRMVECLCVHKRSSRRQAWLLLVWGCFAASWQMAEMQPLGHSVHPQFVVPAHVFVPDSLFGGGATALRCGSTELLGFATTETPTPFLLAILFFQLSKSKLLICICTPFPVHPSISIFPVSLLPLPATAAPTTVIDAS